MEFIDDLSWSNIVNLVQHNDIAGADLVNNFAIELEQVRKEKHEAELSLSRITSREQSLLRAGNHVARHLKKELPLTVQRQGYVVVLNDCDILIERNVI